MTAPALYAVTVRHARVAPLHHAFAYRTSMWLVDLDGPPPAWWLRPFARFRAADHVGDPDRTIRANVDALLAEHGVDLAGGRVLMLSSARVLRRVFNPLTLFWCFAAAGDLAAVVAEVHNTYGGRHCYVVRPDARGRATTDKELYVSPFFPVAGRYRMVLPVPDERLRLAVGLELDGGRPFAASVTGRRTRPTLRALLAQPLTSLRIRRQGVALWARGLAVVPR